MDFNADSHPVRHSSAHRRPFFGRRGVGRPSHTAGSTPKDETPSNAGFGSRTAANPDTEFLGAARWTEDESDPKVEYSCLHFRYRLDCF